MLVPISPVQDAGRKTTPSHSARTHAGLSGRCRVEHKSPREPALWSVFNKARTRSPRVANYQDCRSKLLNRGYTGALDGADPLLHDGTPARRRACAHPARQGFFADSPLEGTGFEPSVPRQEKWSMPSSSDQTRVGRTLTLRGGAESSLEGSDIELSVSPKDIRTSPYDLCANRSDRRQSREGDRWFESTSLHR